MTLRSAGLIGEASISSWSSAAAGGGRGMSSRRRTSAGRPKSWRRAFMDFGLGIRLGLEEGG